LFTDVGGGGDNFQDTILDDEAGSAITSASAPFAGTFRPEGDLSEFDGESLAGTWQLEVRDNRRRQIGTLNGWSITVEHGTTPVAAAAPLPKSPLAVISLADADFKSDSVDDIPVSRFTKFSDEIASLDSAIADWHSPRKYKRESLINSIRTDSRLNDLVYVISSGRDAGKFTDGVANKLVRHADRDWLFSELDELDVDDVDTDDLQPSAFRDSTLKST
jgi:hypothetical protein